MRLDTDIEAELDSLLHERDIAKFDRRLDALEEELRQRELLNFYDVLDPRRKLHVVTDLLTRLLGEEMRLDGSKRLKTKSSLLIVDFENVQQIDFSCIPHNFCVEFVLGAHQKKLSVDLVMAAQDFPGRVVWTTFLQTGTNALDFYLCYRLGAWMSENPFCSAFILSKDKGFSPLVAHLSAAKNIRLIADTAEIAASSLD